MACTCTFDYTTSGNVTVGIRTSALCLQCTEDKTRMEDAEINRKADAELDAIDKKKIRAMCDDLLGVAHVTIDGVTMTPKQYLQSLEDKAAIERGKKK